MSLIDKKLIDKSLIDKIQSAQVRAGEDVVMNDLTDRICGAGEPGDDPPRVSEADVTAAIDRAEYWRVPGTTMVICAMTMTNGFIVTGEARPVCDAAFDEQHAKHKAYAAAREKIWDFLGYALRERLHAEAIAAAVDEAQGDLGL